MVDRSTLSPSAHSYSAVWKRKVLCGAATKRVSTVRHRRPSSAAVAVELFPRSSYRRLLELRTHVFEHLIPAGAVKMDSGAACTTLLLLLAGAVGPAGAAAGTRRGKLIRRLCWQICVFASRGALIAVADPHQSSDLRTARALCLVEQKLHLFAFSITSLNHILFWWLLVLRNCNKTSTQLLTSPDSCSYTTFKMQRI